MKKKKKGKKRTKKKEQKKRKKKNKEEEEEEEKRRKKKKTNCRQYFYPNLLFCFFSLVTTTMEKAGGTRLVTAIPEDGPDPTDGAMRDTTSERTEVFREILLLASRLSFLSLSRSRSELSDLGMVDQ